ncbi:monoglyceride lipase-like [Hibiscus syriacus]|uniref:Monoglyceride lipase-like n=1 Tax=Hibiscus syriacus TaxID=106335 RepID=A0A6A2ZQY0_HIBSY|nr:monoglyceride lipase-like [Hibiscus syriacus]
MAKEESHFFSWPPVGAPLNVQGEEERWKHFDNYVNTVFFCFVVVAIIISMSVVMAIFERFLRTNSLAPPNHGDLQSQPGFNSKLSHPLPKRSIAFSGIFWRELFFSVFSSWSSVLLTWLQSRASFAVTVTFVTSPCRRVSTLLYLVLESPPSSETTPSHVIRGLKRNCWSSVQQRAMQV